MPILLDAVASLYGLEWHLALLTASVDVDWLAESMNLVAGGLREVSKVVVVVRIFAAIVRAHHCRAGEVAGHLDMVARDRSWPLVKTVKKHRRLAFELVATTSTLIPCVLWL